MKNLNANDFASLLANLKTYPEARVWCEGKSLAQAWRECTSPEWMLWLAGCYGNIQHKTFVRIACDCAELALVHVAPDETRPAQCIASVRSWLDGAASIDEVREAESAARAATRAARAGVARGVRTGWAARAAARAATRVARAAREASASRAAGEAWEASRDAAWAAREAGEVASANAKIADIIRCYIEVE